MALRLNERRPVRVLTPRDLRTYAEERAEQRRVQRAVSAAVTRWCVTGILAALGVAWVQEAWHLTPLQWVQVGILGASWVVIATFAYRLFLGR